MLILGSISLCRASAQDQMAIGGSVRNLHGVPQLGALVELLGPGSAVLAHTYTDDQGHYLLGVSSPGIYQLRTSATFLLPALRRNLHVVSGGRTLANITLSALFEVGDWFPVEKRSRTEPADDWRWTLRSSADRPLLRLANSTDSELWEPRVDQPGPQDLPEDRPASVRQHQQLSVLTGSASLVESGAQETWRAERELVAGGIASLQASVSGLSGRDQRPAVLLGTGYGHKNSFTHGEYRVVAGFASLPQLAGAGESGYRAATLATGERIVLGDLVTIDAGTLLSAERLVSSRLSTAPFLRLIVHPASDLAVMYRYAGSREAQNLDDLENVPSSPIPLSDADGRPVGRSTTHQEFGVSRAADRDFITFAAYRDMFAAAAIEGGGASRAGSFANLPVLANAGNGQFVVALGGYTAHGLSASWTHSFSANVKATLEADFGTTLAMQRGKVAELRALQIGVASFNRPALTASIAGEVPRTATAFEVRYHWQPTDTFAVINAFNASADEAYAGLLVRQRMWRGRKLRSVSAVLEASNLLEEGYQPVMGPDGETLFLAQVPRALQAGLAFSF